MFMFTDHILPGDVFNYPASPRGVAMEVPEALKIMRASANGEKTDTGSALEETSICRQPQTVRAQNPVISALVQEQKCQQRKPTNAFRSWTRAEDAQVCAEVRNGIDFHGLAIIGRWCRLWRGW